MDVLANCMFKLGEYDEEEARGIVDYLKEAGMKVDVRTYTSSSLEVFHYLEGRMSEIKEEIDEERFHRYTRFLDAFRKILAEGATSEDFRERLHLELDPQINEKRKHFREIMESGLSQEEREAKIPGYSDLLADLLEVSYAESFVDTLLERNRIKIGEVMGYRLDDPIIRIFADEEGDDESKLARTTTSFIIEPCAEVYVDEFSALFSDELDEEFAEEYWNEYSRLVFLAKLIESLTERSSGKMDMETFSERCELQIENNGNLLEIDGQIAAEELARSLEKNDVIKIKGNSIKWRR
jgi:RNA binding exosome subunit